MSYPSRVLHAQFEKIISRLGFDKVIAVSDATKASLLDSGIDENKVSTIYNGLDYSDFPKHKGSHAGQPFQFLFFGRVGYSKGIDILLSSYARLLSVREDHHLTLVIPSEQNGLFRKMEELIGELDLERKITIIHDLSTPDLHEKIAHSDAVIIPSYSEGFCYAAAETMAIGTPIISSGRKALREVISGRYIEVDQFNVEGFVQAMQLAIEGRWLETPVMKFELEDTIRQYEQMYDKVHQEKGADQ